MGCGRIWTGTRRRGSGQGLWGGGPWGATGTLPPRKGAVQTSWVWETRGQADQTRLTLSRGTPENRMELEEQLAVRVHQAEPMGKPESLKKGMVSVDLGHGAGTCTPETAGCSGDKVTIHAIDLIKVVLGTDPEGVLSCSVMSDSLQPHRL